MNRACRLRRRVFQASLTVIPSLRFGTAAFHTLTLSIFLILLLLLNSCASTKTGSQASSSLPVRLAENVTLPMLDSEYWISRAKNPDKIKMTTAQIQHWNEATENVSHKSPLVCDLRKFDSLMSAEEIRSGMVHYNYRNKWYKKVQTKNGEKIRELSEKDWNVFYEEMNFSPLGSLKSFNADGPYIPNKKDFPVRRAVCVKRSNLRVIPEDDFYSDDQEFWYDDAAQNSGILMNEPVLVLWESKDKKFLYVKTNYCTGWIHREDIAFCTDEQFLRLFNWPLKNPGSFVTVTADRYVLPKEYCAEKLPPDFEIPELFMGTYLITEDWNNQEYSNSFLPRVPHSCFLVQIPFRNEEENLEYKVVALPSSRACYGLLPYTTRNAIQLAFQSLGIRYGWGGMAQARDCSEYLKDIFRCFGFQFPRNSRSQMAMAGKTVSYEGKSTSKKKSLMNSAEPGSVMGIPGHVFMYLGKSDGKHFVISALGSYYPDGFYEEKMDACSVNINTADVLRKNQKNWLENMTAEKLLILEGKIEETEISLDSSWKFAEFSKINSGKACLYRAVENRKNIVIAVNAGHGTKNGSKFKTYSHPDKSPKLTGGTTSAGSVESIAISDGMVFNDGKTESEVNLRTARILKKLLLKNGYDVLMLRESHDTQLDNVARTVISNNIADFHIAIHFDGDFEKSDKGVFYCSIPERLKKLGTVKKHWKNSERLGQCLVNELSGQGFTVYGDGKMEVDLTQTSYSTIPTVDIELGNKWSDTGTEKLEKYATGLLNGIESYIMRK